MPDQNAAMQASESFSQSGSRSLRPATGAAEVEDRLAESLFEEGRLWSAVEVWRGLLDSRSEPPAAHVESELKAVAAYISGLD